MMGRTTLVIRSIFIIIISLGPLTTSALQDGLATTPPMGWRSWNLYGTEVNQEVLIKIMNGLTKKRAPNNKSLQDLGYSRIGLDDNWQRIHRVSKQLCSYHDKFGNPMINEHKFPNMTNLTEYAHSLNLQVDWYFNNCYQCHDSCPFVENTTHLLSKQRPPDTKPAGFNPKIWLQRHQGLAPDICYQGDVQALFDYGYDGVKLDACGWQMDLDKYYALILQKQSKSTKNKPILIEACHWGQTTPDFPNYVYDASLNQTIDKAWCPFHFWRASPDIWSNYPSIMDILLYVQQFAGLSRPGCWAHLDMLEVGVGSNGANSTNGKNDVGLSLEETKTHFAAWAIMSSPLFLSHDVTNETVMEEVWPIISHSEILAIHKAWAGFSGGSFYQSHRTRSYNPTFNVTIPTEYYLFKPLVAAVVSENNNDTHFSSVAVLLINSNEMAYNMTLPFSDIPSLDCGGSISTSTANNNTANITCAVRDVWNQTPLGIYDYGIVIENVESHGTAFLIIENPNVDSFIILNDGENGEGKVKDDVLDFNKIGVSMIMGGNIGVSLRLVTNLLLVQCCVILFFYRCLTKRRTLKETKFFGRC